MMKRFLIVTLMVGLVSISAPGKAATDCTGASCTQSPGIGQDIAAGTKNAAHNTARWSTRTGKNIGQWSSRKGKSVRSWTKEKAGDVGKWGSNTGKNVGNWGKKTGQNAGNFFTGKPAQSGQTSN
ncbi:hypothetical protein AOE01nite_13650 [Acetobacter oeni]|uniref:Uncharacterized protein n=1 Tax=Acetobacter oeni TaxID=304077 RepID=A0A511XJP0_9PROT|nr:hypothetical protein AA21952_0199 [Acetobacter oeni LMG 21952]GEN63141.1 hypothetical protein AOE01nite_13650 [Acetobacter oeni]